MVKQLKEHPHAQCYVFTDDSRTKMIFVSYYTDVIIILHDITDKSYNFKCTGTYSATTRKQIGWFLKEYFPELNYYDMKGIAESGGSITLKDGHKFID